MPLTMNTKKLSFRQMQLVNELVALGAETYPNSDSTFIYTRKELRDMHGVLCGRKASPYFISKNIAAKLPKALAAVYPHGCYTLEPFVKQALAHPPVAPVVAAEGDVKPAKKAKKVTSKNTAKRESKPKRETPVTTETPVLTENAPVSEPVAQ